MASLRMLREAHTHSFHSVLPILWRFTDVQQESLQKVNGVHGFVYVLLITIFIVTALLLHTSQYEFMQISVLRKK